MTTRLEIELLKLIRGLDGGVCLVNLLFNNEDRELANHLIEAMAEVPAEVKA